MSVPGTVIELGVLDGGRRRFHVGDFVHELLAEFGSEFDCFRKRNARLLGKAPDADTEIFADLEALLLEQLLEEGESNFVLAITFQDDLQCARTAVLGVLFLLYL